MHTACNRYIYYKVQKTTRGRRSSLHESTRKWLFSGLECPDSQKNHSREAVTILRSDRLIRCDGDSTLGLPDPDNAPEPLRAFSTHQHLGPPREGLPRVREVEDHSLHLQPFERATRVPPWHVLKDRKNKRKGGEGLRPSPSVVRRDYMSICTISTSIPGHRYGDEYGLPLSSSATMSVTYRK